MQQLSHAAFAVRHLPSLLDIVGDLFGGQTKMRLQIIGELLALCFIQRRFATAGLMTEQCSQTSFTISLVVIANTFPIDHQGLSNLAALPAFTQQINRLDPIGVALVTGMAMLILQFIEFFLT